MNTEVVERLSAVIRKTFQCECDFIASQKVSETYKGRALWAGEVGIFSLSDDGDLGVCYGWEADGLVETTQPVIVPRTADVDSPGAAVRAYILGLCYEGSEREAAHAG